MSIVGYENAGNQEDVMEAHRAHDAMMALGEFTVRFSEIERAPRYPDGDRETDVEHSFHLALSATELAAAYYPHLDVGLVAQFSLVHDMPERYTGDVWTFEISDEDRAKKEEAEKAATERLLEELPPHTAQLLRRYEAQEELEARFVRFVDKLLPAVINAVAAEANTFSQDYGMTRIEEVLQGREKRTAKLRAMFPEFDFIFIVRDLISATSTDKLFPRTGAGE
jgi:5'-deoxynucleotidase YfbR-like HD superfamily hydrolase